MPAKSRATKPKAARPSQAARPSKSGKPKAARPKSSPPKNIDEYLAAFGADQRAALEKLRTTIRGAAPRAEECISYGLAAFRLNGRPLVGLGGTAKHCAFYLMSGSTVAAHADLLAGYDTSKGAIRFPADKPLPAPLVRMLVKARIAENAVLK